MRTEHGHASKNLRNVILENRSGLENKIKMGTFRAASSSFYHSILVK